MNLPGLLSLSGEGWLGEDPGPQASPLPTGASLRRPPAVPASEPTSAAGVTKFPTRRPMRTPPSRVTAWSHGAGLTGQRLMSGAAEPEDATHDRVLAPARRLLR